jgi:hypothetical protein
VKDSTLIAVLCYDGDADQVEHQLPSYTHHGSRVLLLSPQDAPVSLPHPQVTCISAGLSGWKGKHVAYKLMDHWEIMLERAEDWFLVHEPDSVCLSPELPEEIYERDDLLWSMALGEPNQPGVNYNAPWFGHRKVFERMLRESEQHVDEWDAAWSANGGAGMGNSEMVSTVLGADRGHAEGIQGARLPSSVWVYQENDPALLLRSAAQGVRFVTGIKTRELYDQLVQAYAESGAR